MLVQPQHDERPHNGIKVTDPETLKMLKGLAEPGEPLVYALRRILRDAVALRRMPGAAASDSTVHELAGCGLAGGIVRHQGLARGRSASVGI